MVGKFLRGLRRVALLVAIGIFLLPAFIAWWRSREDGAAD